MIKILRPKNTLMYIYTCFLVDKAFAGFQHILSILPLRCPECEVVDKEVVDVFVNEPLIVLLWGRLSCFYAFSYLFLPRRYGMTYI